MTAARTDDSTSLTTRQPAAWRWADDDQVLVWDDGTTIAFRAELEAVLKGLSTIGLPPMPAVVLLLAACRDSWPESSRQLEMPELAAFIDLRRDVLPALDCVAALPRDLRESLESKVNLAAYVFEAAFEEMPNRPRGIEDGSFALTLQTLRDQAPVVVPVLQEMTLGAIGAVRQFLLLGLEHLDPERLRLRRQTGLDQLLRPADPGAEPTEQVRSLLTQLLGDEELSGLARLAQQLVAATSLPRALAGRDELPLGGVSDISNRGSLDRLLVSELAQDDLTLSVRLAMNEALYLRREMPPHEPPQHRLVLLDSGLRMWGVPRLFATATALSLAANAGRTTLSVLRSAGSQLVSVDLTTRDGLLAHLAALDHSVHPGKALPQFRQVMERCVGDCLPVLITGEDVLADREFVAALNELAWPRIMLAIVSREGRLQLLQRSLHGTRLVRETRFDLSEILEPTRVPVSPLVSRRDDRLPAIFSVTPFPLRVPFTVKPDRIWVCGKSVVTLSPTNQLVIFDRPDRGPRLVVPYFPSGVVWLKYFDVPQPMLRAVVSSFNKNECRVIHELITVRLDERSHTRIRLRTAESMPSAAFTYVGNLIAIERSKRIVRLFDNNGAEIDTLKYPREMSWERSRFMRDGFQWSVIANNGQRLSFEPVPHTRLLNRPLMGLFDPPDSDGPLGITFDGQILNTHSGEALALSHEARISSFSEVSCDDERVRLMTKQGTKIVDLKSRSFVTKCEPEVDRLVRTKPIRTRFCGIEATVDGTLALYSLKSTKLQIAARFGILRFVAEPVVLEQCYGRVHYRPFTESPSAESTRLALQVAEWADGSRAVLDPRGLLHLQSSDPDIPEATIVLHDDELAVWCSDGRVIGSEYFFLDDVGQRTGPIEILHDVIGAFARHVTKYRKSRGLAPQNSELAE